MVRVIFCDLPIADLEGHNPTLAIAIEIGHANVTLNERIVNVRLVIDLLSFVHVFVKYKNMLVSHDKQKFFTIESIDEECITEHF